MEIETTVDEYFDTIDLTNTPGDQTPMSPMLSQDDCLDQKMLSDHCMPPLSTTMSSDQTKFWGSMGDEMDSMGFPSSLGSNDIFSTFSDPIKEVSRNL